MCQGQSKNPVCIQNKTGFLLSDTFHKRMLCNEECLKCVVLHIPSLSNKARNGASVLATKDFPKFKFSEYVSKKLESRN